jgi:hypothetical protein
MRTLLIKAPLIRTITAILTLSRTIIGTTKD